MIPRLHGWNRDERDDVITLTRRDDPTAGVIRYRERARPLRTFEQILTETLAALPDLTIVVAGEPQRLVTREGEPAATATIEGRFEGAPVALVLGVVFGDDFYARIVGRATRPDAFAELAAAVRELAVRDVHALGVRRRSLQHRGPDGWRACARGLTTDWVEPAAAEAVIRVFPAEPNVGGGDPLEVLFAAAEAEGRVIDLVDGPHDLTLAPGLIGATWRIGGDGLRCDLAVLQDARYEYAVVMESRTEDAQARHRAAMHELLRSILPLAAAGRVTATEVDGAFSHWTL